MSSLANMIILYEMCSIITESGPLDAGEKGRGSNLPLYGPETLKSSVFVHYR